MRKLNAIIVEDEQENQDLLTDFIETRDDLEIKDYAKDAKEALSKLKKNKYDIVFLDIFLPDRSGISVIEEVENPPYIIFTTAYQEHAVRAFELGAVDYLVKPLAIERFNMAVDRAIHFFKLYNENMPHIEEVGLSVHEKEQYFVVPYDQIVYLSAHNKYTVIHTRDREIRTLKYLQEIEKKVPANQFVRVHRQYVINIRYLRRIQHDNSGRYIAELNDTDDTVLTVSRTYAESLKKLLKE